MGNQRHQHRAWSARAVKATIHQARKVRSRPFRRSVAMLLAVLPALCFMVYRSFSQSAGNAKTPAVERGRQLFETNCAFCHGPNATGARGPDLVRSKLVNDDVNGNLVGQVILSGRPHNVMPAFTLSRQQIQDIADFLHFQINAALSSASVADDYPLSRLLTGNAEKGKAYFYGAGKCSSCHSPTGDLAHIASKYRPIDLEGRMIYPEDVPQTVTVTLPSGKTLEGPLISLDEFSVALRDPSGWYRSFSRSQVKVDVHDPLAAHRALLSQLTQADIHNLFAYLETLK
jgi:cytochrome c oxidase cbb3-type subunit III